MLQVFHGFSKNVSVEPKDTSHLETENDDESNVQLNDKFVTIFPYIIIFSFLSVSSCLSVCLSAYLSFFFFFTKSLNFCFNRP